MARYAIGDIQGCMASLDRLLALIDFKPHVDELWLVGDLVNRGPRSLDVLRWARALGPVVTCVLGNHDLHLLARAGRGQAQAGRYARRGRRRARPQRADRLAARAAAAARRRALRAGARRPAPAVDGRGREG